ncbi:cytochrome P450 [Massariosphaeria phaeospora]|uniref:Cytochrome P450 n=1 Tax=Massariosphaeria phaeospora TaxID=100035 RepID=A0A7C8IGY1_9PLEO|nr:cytochrome P450 [Massariosphaeria phaeospora]
MQFVGDEAMTAFIHAFCGPHLLRLCPGFLQDFWDFDRSLHVFLQGVPRIFAPRAYASRKKVLDAVKTWQKHAREHGGTATAPGGPHADDDDDPFWGSSFFRERHKMFLEMDGYTTPPSPRKTSAQYGRTSHHIPSHPNTSVDPQTNPVPTLRARNSITATSWTVFELFRSPSLLAAVRAEVASCTTTSNNHGHVQFDTDRLLRLPLFQAVYAETLRLRMHFYVIRMPGRVDMDIRDWVIPCQSIVCTSTTAAHMGSQAWPTGLDNEYPVDTFGAGRFLTRPNPPPPPPEDPQTGHSARPDAKPPAREEDSQTAHGTRADAKTNPPTFSLTPVSNSWIPYGGGPRQCPGRQFAKRQILLTTVLFITLFDVEILGGGADVKEDLRSFSMGVAHPAGKVPCRMRRRRRERGGL